MVVLVIAVLFALATIGVAIQANAHFRREDRLPMQWLLSRSRPLSETVVWSAPRGAALGLIPGLAVVSLALFTLASLTTEARPGQEGYLIPALLLFGSGFVGAQLLHLWMIARTLSRRAG